MKIPVSFWTAYARANKNILVDSGATDNFINPRLIQRLRLGTHNLEWAQKIWNINGTNNKAGLITNYVDLSIQTGQKQAKIRFLITDLGNKDLILGYPWLANFEPKFSWSNGVIDTSYLPIIIQSLDWETWLNWDTISQTITEPLSEQERVQIVEDLEDKCSLKASISNRLARDAQQYQDKVEIPKEYQKHWKVFSKEEAHQFPPSRPWDHAIELKDGAPKAIDCKIIPTMAEEDKASRSSSKNSWKRGTSESPNHHTHQPSSSSKRRMAVKSLVAPECLAWARSRFLWIKGFSGTMGRVLDEGAKPKLDRC